MDLLPFPWSTPIQVCQFDEPVSNIPTFSESGCQTEELSELDAQNVSIWVSIRFDLPERWIELEQPYGLYLFGKASSRVYLNGNLLGANGAPSRDQSEIAGKMDASIYAPVEYFREVDNQLVLHLSAMHSVVTLARPFHAIGFGQFGDPRQFLQQYSTPGLVLVGAFAVGFFYFLLLGMVCGGSGTYKLFAALCLFSALQLGVEMLRGLVCFSYPWQDIRLLLVTGLSFLFGVSLLIHSSLRVTGDNAAHWIYGGVILTALVMAFVPGFDIKTNAGVFVPLMVSLIQLLVFWRRSRERNLLVWFVVQLLVVIAVVADASSFHEISHFIIVGGLLVYLFAQQKRAA